MSAAPKIQSAVLPVASGHLQRTARTGLSVLAATLLGATLANAQTNLPAPKPPDTATAAISATIGAASVQVRPSVFRDFSATRNGDAHLTLSAGLNGEWKPAGSPVTIEGFVWSAFDVRDQINRNRPGQTVTSGFHETDIGVSILRQGLLDGKLGVAAGWMQFGNYESTLLCWTPACRADQNVYARASARTGPVDVSALLLAKVNGPYPGFHTLLQVAHERSVRLKDRKVGVGASVAAPIGAGAYNLRGAHAVRVSLQGSMPVGKATASVRVDHYERLQPGFLDGTVVSGQVAVPVWAKK
ncbi:MAG: hypothetical protein ACKVPX_12655 [Myxococcaceae bacterium]